MLRLRVGASPPTRCPIGVCHRRRDPGFRRGCGPCLACQCVMQSAAGPAEPVAGRCAAVPAQFQAGRSRDGLSYLRHGEMVCLQLGRELGLAETAEARAEFAHGEARAEQRHVLPSQPHDRVHNRPLAQPALDDPRVG